MAAHTRDARIWETEAGGQEFRVLLGYTVSSYCIACVSPYV